MMDWIRTRWRRSAVVDQPDPEKLVLRLTVDHGNGRVEMLLAHKNDTFGLAYLCSEALRLGMNRMTLSLTNRGYPESFQFQSVEIPNWARKSVFRDVVKLAKEFGWEGQCPIPTSHTAYRSSAPRVIADEKLSDSSE